VPKNINGNLETAGSKPLWPMREFMGYGENNEKISREVYRDMRDGKIYAPEGGWNDDPPPIGNPGCITRVSEAYRQGYDQIRWDK
jgi:hypothetical protein